MLNNFNQALLCNKAGRQINALSRLSNVLNVDTVFYIVTMYCCIIWHFCSISDTKKIEKMQLSTTYI